MNKNEEKEEKGNLRNFKFAKSADDRLTALVTETGKNMTKILEDYLLERRQFRPEIERFLADEMARTNRTRNEIIEAALVAAMRNPAWKDEKTIIDTVSYSERPIQRHLRARQQHRSKNDPYLK